MAAARRIRRRGWMDAARKRSQREVRPTIAKPVTSTRSGAPVPDARAYIFDVEGTLVDTVLPSLNCWCQTLAEFGFSFRTADLHCYSGMDGREMLAQLLPQNRELHDFILSKYNWRFRTEVLPTVRAVPGARELLATLKRRGAKIALATNCHADELAHYRTRLGIDGSVDTAVSDDDVQRGKPLPDAIVAALKRLGAEPSDAVFVGDTPYDAEAARQARVRSFGVLTGHFPRADLLGAGCSAIFLDPKSLSQALAEPEAA
jgi:HAD superfamily hydrolase (TIGR01509 family)